MLGVRNLVLGSVVLAAVGLPGCEGPTLSMRISREMSQQSEAYRLWWDQEIVWHRNANVFFSPHGGEYYWFGQGQWHQGTELPSRFMLRHDDVRVVPRSRLLALSMNAPYVMAFNPYFAAPAPDPAMDEETLLADTDFLTDEPEAPAGRTEPAEADTEAVTVVEDGSGGG